MSRVGTQGLSAGDAVLGLVIDRPDYGYSLVRRLGERFGPARFTYSTTYRALERMEQRGMVRVLDGESAQAVGATAPPATVALGDAGADATSEHIYEATPQGVTYFRKWLRAGGRGPRLREELHAKIAFCEPRDLPRVIDIVWGEELECIAELEAIRQQTVDEQESAVARPLAEEEWSTLMGGCVGQGDAAFWDGRIKHLGQLRGYLEELRGEAERRALQAHRRGSEETRRSA
jgi:DNA-binding PadR family transcriptional regulator